MCADRNLLALARATCKAKQHTRAHMHTHTHAHTHAHTHRAHTHTHTEHTLKDHTRAKTLLVCSTALGRGRGGGRRRRRRCCGSCPHPCRVHGRVQGPQPHVWRPLAHSHGSWRAKDPAKTSSGHRWLPHGHGSRGAEQRCGRVASTSHRGGWWWTQDARCARSG